MEHTYSTAPRLGSFRSRQRTPFQRLLCLGAALLALGFVSLTAQVQVEIQNLAAVSPQAIDLASQAAERTFSVAGIETSWRLMGSEEPRAETTPRLVRLRLVSSRHAFSANPHALGEALVTDGGGSLAIVYVDRVRAFAQKHRLPLSIVLAYAAAHEVGHLLRGDNQHTQSGLMRACWDRRDAEDMRSGTLAPDAESASEMAGKLGSIRSQTVALAAAPRPQRESTVAAP